MNRKTRTIYLFLVLMLGILPMGQTSARSQLGQGIAPAGNGIRFASVFDGSNAGEKLTRAIADLPATGGTIDARGLEGAQTVSSAITIAKSGVTILLGAGTYTFSGAGQFILLDGVSDFHLIGAGGTPGGPTLIDHTADNYFIDVAATAVARGVHLEKMFITTTSASADAGAIRVGRINQLFDEKYYRHDWRLQDIQIVGPGETTPGSVGVSLSQVGRLQIDHVLISSYQTNLIMASTTEAVSSGLEIDNFQFGLKLTQVPGHPRGGACSDTFYGTRFHGPTTGTHTGVSLYVDCQNDKFYGTYMELNKIGYTGKAFVEFTQDGQYSRFFGTYYNYTNGTFLNTMVFAPGAARNVFVGEMTNISAPPISMADPAGGRGSTQNVFMGCDSFLAESLSAAINAGYAVFVGAAGSGGVDLGLHADVRGDLTAARVGVNTSPSFTAEVNKASPSTSFTTMIQSVISNSDSTNNNYANLGFSQGRGTVNAAVGSQVRSHATGLADLVFGANGGSGTSEKWRILGDQGGLQSSGAVFANLGNPSNGTIQFCTNCKGPGDRDYAAGSSCADGGSGALAVKIAGWRCY